MKKTARHPAKQMRWPILLLWVAAFPVLLALLVSGLGATALMRQWVPQAGAVYISYLTAVIFYLVGPLPLIKTIKRFPLPVAYGYAILWTAILACAKSILWPEVSANASGLLLGIIAVSATASGLIGTKLTV